MLQHLFTILRLGSPRTRCLCLRILRQVVPLSDPHKVLPALPAWIPVKQLRSRHDPKALNNLTSALLNVVGTCLLPTTSIAQQHSTTGSSNFAASNKLAVSSSLKLKTASSSNSNSTAHTGSSHTSHLLRAHTLRYQNSNVGTAGGAASGGSNTSGFTDLVGYGSGDSR